MRWSEDLVDVTFLSSLCRSSAEGRAAFCLESANPLGDGKDQSACNASPLMPARSTSTRCLLPDEDPNDIALIFCCYLDEFIVALAGHEINPDLAKHIGFTRSKA